MPPLLRIYAVVVTAFIVELSPTRAQSLPSTQPAVVIETATNDELAPVIAQFTKIQIRRIRGVQIYSGLVGGRSLAAAATGGGKTNAGATTMLLILTVHPRFIVMSGTAGGMNDDLLPGDIVISERLAQSDYGTQRDVGFTARGTPNPSDGSRNPIFIPGEESLLAAARRLSANTLDLSPAAFKGVKPLRQPCILFGTIVSNDVFSDSPRLRQQVRRLFGADAMDMESAAVAQICYQQQVPFIAVRGITDGGDEQAGLNYERWRGVAAHNAATVCIEIVKMAINEDLTP